VALVAALAGWHAWSRGGAHALAWRDVAAEVGPWQFTHTTGRAYRSRAALVEYLEIAWPGHHPRLPPIDFRREEAVLVAVGPRSGSGYDLRVVRVADERGRVEILLREHTPALANPGRPGVTYPYRLLVFRHSDKHVTVRFLGRP
jgi:hypothetical protein